MNQSIVPVSPEKHGELRLKTVSELTFAKNIHITPLIITEVTNAAHYYPMVFIEQDGQKVPFALLGLANDENLFVSPAGKWLVKYVPASIRRFPFYLANIEEREGEFAVCIDEKSPLFSSSEGEPLYDQDGKQTQVIDRAMEFLSQYKKGEQLTLQAMKEIEKYGLFDPLQVNIKQGEEKDTKTVNCGSRINEQKFNELSNDDFMNLREKGCLPLIYSHFFSLQMLQSLFDLLTVHNKIKTDISANTALAELGGSTSDTFHFS